MKIPIESAYFLMLRYPPLANYIQEAYNRGHHDDMLDLIFGLETDIILHAN